VKASPEVVMRLASLSLLVLLTVLIWPSHVSGQAREVVSYEIQVRLDAEAKRLDGRERVTLLNRTSQPVSELYFHLYPNAFRGPDSTFMRESPGTARQAAAEDNWGWMDVTSLRLATGGDLLAGATVDDTLMRVPLPAPLEPGRSIDLDLEFSVQLPRVIARMGHQDDHFTVAQWFPKLAALIEGRGWVAHHYHANSEFFANFGRYRVEITLPERFVVGASGVPAGERGNGDGTKTLTFEARSVHDFAWVANPGFQDARARAGDVEIRLLYLPENEGLRDRFLDAAVASVEHFSRWYGPYAYPLLTVAAVPFDAGGGMEYPTLVTVNDYGVPLSGLLLEEQVTIHEIAHQWWYGMVASNEFEEAWLDEGFTSYSTRKLADLLYGPEQSMGRVFGLNVDQLGTERGQYMSVARQDPVVQPSWEFSSPSSYAGNVYAKASLILGTLEGHLGEELMGEVMRTYFQRFAFAHPTTEDFIDIVHEVSGRDFSGFFQDALYSPVIFDYAVESLSVRRGAGGLSSDLRSEVTVTRLGVGATEVDVVTTFQDGHQEWEAWDGVALYQRYEYVRSSPAVKVEVDPERKLLLDVNWANNSHTTWYNWEPVLKWATNLLWLAQTWLRVLAFLF
jgi:hypothetical protein